MSNMALHKWEDTQPDHVIALASNLRDYDRLEVIAYGCGSPVDVVQSSVRLSSNPKTWTVDGQVALICGVVKSRVIGSATPWVLTTSLVDQYPYIFLKGSKYIVDEWKKEYPYLHNYVDSRYEKAVKWLHWLGFNIHPAIPMGPESIMFNPVDWGYDNG